MSEFQLKLYVTGDTSRSQLAIRNLHDLCERYLPGRYDVEVIDLLEHPEEAEKHRILATPMLLKVLPPPIGRIIGDLSDSRNVLIGLGLPQSDDSSGDDDGI